MRWSAFCRRGESMEFERSSPPLCQSYIADQDDLWSLWQVTNSRAAHPISLFSFSFGKKRNLCLLRGNYTYLLTNLFLSPFRFFVTYIARKTRQDTHSRTPHAMFLGSCSPDGWPVGVAHMLVTHVASPHSSSRFTGSEASFVPHGRGGHQHQCCTTRTAPHRKGVALSSSAKTSPRRGAPAMIARLYVPVRGESERARKRNHPPPSLSSIPAGSC
jgi:hypothetical protein